MLVSELGDGGSSESVKGLQGDCDSELAFFFFLNDPGIDVSKTVEQEAPLFLPPVEPLTQNNSRPVSFVRNPENSKEVLAHQASAKPVTVYTISFLLAQCSTVWPLGVPGEGKRNLEHIFNIQIFLQGWGWVSVLPESKCQQKMVSGPLRTKVMVWSTPLLQSPCSYLRVSRREPPTTGFSLGRSVCPTTSQKFVQGTASCLSGLQSANTQQCLEVCC